MSFQLKLLIFALSLVVVPALVVTFVSSGSTNRGMIQSNEEYLTNFVQEKATSVELQLESAIQNLKVLGETVQHTINDNFLKSFSGRLPVNYLSYPLVSMGKDDFEKLLNQLPSYQQQILNLYYKFDATAGTYSRPDYSSISPEALSSIANVFRSINIPVPYGNSQIDTFESVDILIPASKFNDRTRQLVQSTTFIDSFFKPIFNSNKNNSLVYYIGDTESPFLKSYPNFKLAEYFGEAANFVFWRDFFTDFDKYAQKYFADQEYQKKVLENVGSQVVINRPYVDAAGQGQMITLFYPLQNNEKVFQGAIGLDIVLENIINNSLEIHVAENGYAFLMNGHGNIIALPDRGQKQLHISMEKKEVNENLEYITANIKDSNHPAIKELAKSKLLNSDATLGYNRITLQDGEQSVIAFASLKPIMIRDPFEKENVYYEDAWKIVISVPENEILASLYTTVTTIWVIVGILIVLFILIAVIYARSITKNIKALAAGAEEISKKNYNVKVDIRSKDEIGDLGRVFNLMTSEIKDYTENLEEKVEQRTAELQTANEQIMKLNEKLKDENLRLGAELDVAKQLQLMVLPKDKEIRDVADLDIACTMNPADEVGGDYYDILKSNGSVTIGIGDVTGHGLSAGVIMLMAQTAIRTMKMTGEKSMKRVLSVLNNVLYANITRIKEDKNMTLSLINYSPEGITITGQHESVVIVRNNGAIEIKETTDLGIFVGMLPDIEHLLNDEKIQLNTGDVLVLFTDGIPEAIDVNGIEYGMERFSKAIQANYQLSSQEILDNVLVHLYNYIGKATIYDDISMVVLKKK